ncbi:hypothetical protein [Herbiconiux daphne]|uniref:Uncharacterized protein n=1 Tax=Herbiconiux daphne TaxID=2970914 RepID=A0ABT2HAT1_9MICO|nr:hypothetical protein [Herbiconiux daphne]MCS5737012.1 hypothetical protein [Herbiconiux daphne]
MPNILSGRLLIGIALLVVGFGAFLYVQNTKMIADITNLSNQLSTINTVLEEQSNQINAINKATQSAIKQKEINTKHNEGVQHEIRKSLDKDKSGDSLIPDDITSRLRQQIDSIRPGKTNSDKP